MRFLAVAAFVFMLPMNAEAQGTPECYANFASRPGGKACCDASYKRSPQGAMRNKERMSSLEACVARAESKGKK